MLDNDSATGASTASAPCGGGTERRLLSASRRQSSDPVPALAMRAAASCGHLTDDDTPPDSAAGHVTAAGSTQAYPGFVERAFFVLDQTTAPRSWCLRLITWPYPLLLLHLTTGDLYAYCRVKIPAVIHHIEAKTRTRTGTRSIIAIMIIIVEIIR